MPRNSKMPLPVYPRQDVLILLALIQQRTEASYACRETQCLLWAAVEYRPMLAFHTAEWEQTVSENITLLEVLHTSENSDRHVKAARKGAHRCHVIHFTHGLNRDFSLLLTLWDISWVISEVSVFYHDFSHWNILVSLRPRLMNYPNPSECVFSAPYYSYFVPIYYLLQWKSSFQILPLNHSQV